MASLNMDLKDWLDDLCVRFIVNLPKEELGSIERICFQIEEAQWFYEDFVRPLDAQLPSLNLKNFCMLIFQQCSLFAGWEQELYLKAFEEFLTYKTRVPVRGAIMLNEAMDQCVLVKGWKKSANWSFPRGKINKGEADLACAIREVYEETGFDIQEAGLVPGNEDQVKSIEITMREQHMKLFVFHGVPMDTHFQPRTRKEISSIQWYRLSDLPTLKKSNPKQQQQHHQQDGQGENLATNANKFYMVAPFMSHLKKYIAGMRKRNSAKQHEGLQVAYSQDPAIAEMQQAPVQKNAPGTTPAHVLAAGGTDGNDMSRLLNQLRQSSQASREQDLPEVIPPHSLAPSSSARAQAQDLLNAPAKQANLTSTSSSLLHMLQAPRNVQQAPSAVPPGNDIVAPPNAIQQFLTRSQAPSPMPPIRPSASTSPAPWQHGHFQTMQHSMRGSVPQTPLEQVFGQPEMPASPKHHHRPHQPSAAANTGPPPAFPFSPVQVRHESNQQQQQSQHPGVPHMPAQALWPDATPQGPIARARSPAPYQQSGDHDFSSAPQTASSVPEASELAPPKLNANTAKLLSLFKTTKQSAAAEMSGETTLAPEANTIQAPNDSRSMANVSPASALVPQRSLAPPVPISTRPDPTLTPSLASPTEIGPSSPATSRPRTSQQNTLLDLFKGQPSRASSGAGRASGTLSPALAPAPSAVLPPVPIELANASSPAAASTASNDKRRSGSREALAPGHHGRITIQKRPPGHTPAASMSATVSGPLQVTEQDFQRQQSSAAMTPGSVKILSRPGTASGPSLSARNLEASPKTVSPKPGRSPRRRHEQKVQPSPKPFQPQILKRPAARGPENVNKELHISPPTMSAPQILRREPELPSPMSRQTSLGTGIEPISAITPAPADTFDRRISQSSDQKATLLSLFQKPAAQPAVSPLNSLPRTRLGSLASTGSGETGRITPQTNEKDRKFLLGFLNNVVNESK